MFWKKKANHFSVEIYQPAKYQSYENTNQTWSFQQPTPAPEAAKSSHTESDRGGNIFACIQCST